MPGRTPADAFDAFAEPIKRVASCISRDAHVTFGPRSREVGRTNLWSLNNTRPVVVGRGARGIKATMHYEIHDLGQSRGDERFKVVTRGYLYAITRRDGVELLAAHWHPDGLSDHRTPHWHVMAAATSEEGQFLTRQHVPSPRVSFESMVRILLEDDDIEPARADWEEVLEVAEANFTQHKTW